ncbi:MAG: hypothetical protein VYA34_08740 [Myxococcota bacterium]|nr:hypothetical protein [Myxococcota bacterium]
MTFWDEASKLARLDALSDTDSFVHLDTASSWDAFTLTKSKINALPSAEFSIKIKDTGG